MGRRWAQQTCAGHLRARKDNASRSQHTGRARQGRRTPYLRARKDNASRFDERSQRGACRTHIHALNS